MKHRPGEGGYMTTTTNNICDEIARRICVAIAHGEIANCVASSTKNALLAVDKFATARGEQYDLTRTNDGAIEAWGWSDETPEGEMAWRVIILIVPAKMNT
jgi:hypothetical protein